MKRTGTGIVAVAGVAAATVAFRRARRAATAQVPASSSPAALPVGPDRLDASAPPEREGPRLAGLGFGGLSEDRARLLVRATAWSETLLGLLAVVITLLIGRREDDAELGSRDDDVTGIGSG